jgi:predicted ABC-type ATPase
VSDNALVLNNSVSSGYLASILSDFLRRHWLEAGESFTFETVMSSRDKLGLIAAARKVGYRTYLYYVCTDAVMINTERVANRVLNGGHSVAEDKIQARYERSLSFLPEAIRLSDRAFLFDNSGSSHRLVGEFELGRPIKIEDNPPGWVTAL